MARCPVHDDRTPSLSISSGKDGKVLVHCHAGCEQRHLIAALERRGLWQTTESAAGRLRAHLRRSAEEPAVRRSEMALAIWRRSQSARGTAVEAYLQSRGLLFPVPAILRFHAGLKHHSGSFWPAMVALVTHGVDDAPMGIHRTFLAHDGSGKAPVDPAKMMLGPCRGGVVRLAKPSVMLMVGEGIETCLAAMQATRNPAWAALSTSGLRALGLPREVRDVIVLADGDGPGEAAACDCARRWMREGRRVRVARPPRGMDFNDLLILGGRA
jgi:DNA primase